MIDGVLLLAVLAVVAALVLAFLWRASESRASALAQDLTRRTEERDDLEQRLAREKSGRKKQTDELVTLRKRIEKTRKRQGKSPEQPLGTAARISDLEERISRAEAERDQGLAAKLDLEGELMRVQAQLKVSAEALMTASQPAEVEPRVEDPLDRAEAETRAGRERIAKLEAELAAARETEVRMRKRTETQEQLYASLRAELEVKKDRLRTQEEQLQRLQALKVAIAD